MVWQPTFYVKSILARKNVELLGEDPILLKCKTCGQMWSPNLQTGGIVPKDFWKCPNGCNDEEG